MQKSTLLQVQYHCLLQHVMRDFQKMLDMVMRHTCVGEFIWSFLLESVRVFSVAFTNKIESAIV